MITLAHLWSILIRVVTLGAIVFASATYIPAQPITFDHKVTISVVVVAVYMFLDQLYNLLVHFRYWLCHLLCSCSPAGEHNLELDDLDVEKLRRELAIQHLAQASQASQASHQVATPLSVK